MTRPRHRAEPGQWDRGATDFTPAETTRRQSRRRGLDFVKLVTLPVFEPGQKVRHGPTGRLCTELRLGLGEALKLLVGRRDRAQEPPPCLSEEPPELRDVPAVEPWPDHGQSALIGMMAPLAAGVLGSVIVSSPFLNDAVTLLPSTATGRRTLRAKLP